MRALLALTVCSVTLAASAIPAVAEPRTPIFTPEREACFGRVYDAAHLKAHPRQKATSFFVMRDLERRREAENWRPDARAQAIQMFRENGLSTVAAFVTFRDRKGNFHNSLTCEEDEASKGVRCMIECDGGSFQLRRAGANAVMLQNNGFVLTGGCGEESEDGQRIHFDPGEDDKVFRLEARPLAVCRAEEQKAAPIPAGIPLRERFKQDERFCFGRDYDAAHLAKNPKQAVTQIRVGRLTPDKEQDEDAGVQEPNWWFNVKLDVSLTLRSGAKSTTARYACTPLDGSWECHRRVQRETASACNERSFHLIRTTSGDIMLRNRNSGLPIDNECETANNGEQFPTRPPTRTDDRLFRLTRMPVDACR